MSNEADFAGPTTIRRATPSGARARRRPAGRLIRCRCVTLALLAVVLLGSPGARADGCERCGAGTVHGVLGLAALVDVGGLVTVFGLAANVGSDERPGDGWLAFGGMFGLLETAGGLGFLIVGSGSSENRGLIAFSSFTLALGLAHDALAIGGACMDEKEEEAFVLRVPPLLLPDGRGGYATGVGLSVLGF